MTSSSKIILNKEAIENNWKYLRHAFGANMKISAVVKGNAYGHGISTYVPLAEACGVNHFSVFNSGEAYAVHEVAHPDTTIMIMGAMDDDDIEWAVANDIEFYVFDMYRLNRAVEVAKELNKKAIIHIEAETGMYRTGFDAANVPTVIVALKTFADQLIFKGLCMHFAGAEHISNYVRLRQQKMAFRKIVSLFRTADLHPEIIHTCCSAAALRFPDMRYDMLRIGILQYGFWPSAEMKAFYLSEEQLNTGQSPIRRVIRWESRIMSIKHVPKGSFVGYGYTFLAEEDMKVAVVPVGYAHGFSRGLSNSGSVLINGSRVPVIGVVNMNCIAVDVTRADEVHHEDEVVLIGTQGEREISVASFGDMTNQLNYELLTRLPLNIPRVTV